MSKAVLVIDMPESCSKCKFMYEFYGAKKCHLLNILQNGGKAVISIQTLTKERKDCCPLVPLPERKECNDLFNFDDSVAYGFNQCLNAIGGNDSDGG